MCLVYALMTGIEIYIKAIIKSTMWKARAHKGHKYVLGGSLQGSVALQVFRRRSEITWHHYIQ